MSGRGIAILVNANAKRGGRRVAVQIGRMLPRARVRLTRNQGEISVWLKELLGHDDVPRVIFAAGGDGTVIGLVNALDHVVPRGAELPIVGVLKLGTGNAWANTVGAPKLAACLDLLARLQDAYPESRPLPTRRFGLVDCMGTLTHFAGCGWDAQILDDYKQQLAASKGPPRLFARSVYGYLSAMLLRTAPKTLLFGRPHVLVENLGDEVYTLTPQGRLRRLDDLGYGAVLYDGLASVAGAATCREFGYHFRAYPFAERFLGMLNVRIYERSAPAAIKDIPDLWVGRFPLRGMHDWFTTAVRMTFSRPMALEIGGDAVGLHRSIEYRISRRTVRILDWNALR